MNLRRIIYQNGRQQYETSDLMALCVFRFRFLFILFRKIRREMLANIFQNRFYSWQCCGILVS